MTEAQSVADNTVHDALVFEVMPIGREVTCDDILTRMGDKRPLGFRGYGVRNALLSGSTRGGRAQLRLCRFRARLRFTSVKAKGSEMAKHPTIADCAPMTEEMLQHRRTNALDGESSAECEALAQGASKFGISRN